MSTVLNLGVIDSWDFSVTIGLDHVVVWASSPGDLNNGWYRAKIDYAGSISGEQRMLPEGDWDKHPNTNRPPMRTMITMIPAEYPKVTHALKSALGLE